MAMTRPQYNFKKVSEYNKFLITSLDYLEKASSSNLGDFTPEGKVVNAGYNNYTIFWQWYKEVTGADWQKQPYCAGYQSIMLTCGFGIEKAKKLLNGEFYIYCPDGYNAFKAKNKISTTPVPGSIVFFWSNDLGRWGHTGYVLAVDTDGKGYTTIEANTSSGNDTLVRNGGAVCRKHYTLGQRKVAFGLIDWEGNGIENDVISKSEDDDKIEEHITCGNKGLIVAFENKNITSLNVRSGPGTKFAIVGSLDAGDTVFVDGKSFFNGKAWYHITKSSNGSTGWVSASYLTGWVQEANGKWWYLLPGYKWYADQIVVIDGCAYFFDSSGYMFVGTITFKTDENGVLKAAN